MKIAFYLFTRDLHINNKFIEICEENNIVIPMFIFTQQQISDKNKYRSIRSIIFMIECLQELYNELNNKLNLNLYYLYSETYENIFNNNFQLFIKQLYKINENIDLNFYMCNDYTNYAQQRIKYIKDKCNLVKIKFNVFEHICLFPPGTILSGTNTTYRKFTPFYNKCISNINIINEYLYSNDISKLLITKFSNNKNKEYIDLYKIINNHFSNNYNININDILYNSDKVNITKKQYNELSTNMFIHGGRNNALKILKNISKQYILEYESKRDVLTYETTSLSAYLKYGCINVKEVYQYLKKIDSINSALFRQLIWRDFYMHISNEYKHIIFNGKSFKSDYDKIIWTFNKEKFNAWCEGKTGFPIIDACMRQLNTTGYMHNRGRLIVSSFLVKNLLIDWRHGEKYFAQQLIDYDPHSNNGNWQWVSGSGVDSQPYFRIFNPYSQSSKHDINALYIKKFIHELKDIEPIYIHNWNKYYDKYVKQNIYIKPIIEYNNNEFKELYKKYLN